EKINKIKNIIRTEIKKKRPEINAEIQQEIKKKIEELESKRQEMLKENNKIKLEKDFIMRKITSFKKQAVDNTNNMNSVYDDEILDESHNQSNTKHYMEDINSDCGKMLSEKSGNTSMDNYSNADSNFHFSQHFNMNTT